MNVGSLVSDADGYSWPAPGTFPLFLSSTLKHADCELGGIPDPSGFPFVMASGGSIPIGEFSAYKNWSSLYIRGSYP